MAGIKKIPRAGTPGRCYRHAHFHDATVESPVPTHSVRWVGGQVPEDTTAPQPAGSTLALNLNPLGLFSGEPPDSWPRVGAPLLAPRIVRWFTVIEWNGMEPGRWINIVYPPDPGSPPRTFPPVGSYDLGVGLSLQAFSTAARLAAWESVALAAFAGAGGVAVPEFSPFPADNDLFFSRPGTPPVDMALHRVGGFGREGSDFGGPTGIHSSGPFLPFLAPDFVTDFVGADVLNVVVYCNLGPGHGYYVGSPASLSPAPDFAGRTDADLERLRAAFGRFAGHRTCLFYDIAPPRTAGGNPYVQVNPDGTVPAGGGDINEHLFLADQDFPDANVLVGNYDVEAPLYWSVLPNTLVPATNGFPGVLQGGLAGLATLAARGADVGLAFAGGVSSQSPDPAPFVALIKNHFNLA